MKKKILLIGILSVLMLNSIRSQSINFEIIGFTNNGNDVKDIEIITNDGDFTRKWKSEVDKRKAILSIDFEKECVVVISRGQCGSGGYGIGVDSIYRDRHDLIVEITYSDPGENCRRTMGLTRPTLLIRVKNKDLPFTFRESTIIKNCDSL
jgi:hypothetical protein